MESKKMVSVSTDFKYQCWALVASIYQDPTKHISDVFNEFKKDLENANKVVKRYTANNQNKIDWSAFRKILIPCLKCCLFLTITNLVWKSMQSIMYCALFYSGVNAIKSMEKNG